MAGLKSKSSNQIPEPNTNWAQNQQAEKCCLEERVSQKGIQKKQSHICSNGSNFVSKNAQKQDQKEVCQNVNIYH